jgi:type IV fimbrial biogenesis protein FimT
MDQTNQRGFTLYELLITVLVMGVIFGLGMPNLLEFARNNRMAATANDLVGALHFARSEAVSGRVPVTLCASPEPVADNPSCDAAVADAATQGGYVVWIDANADAVIDGGERLLLQRDDPQDITIFSSNGVAASGYIHFGRNRFVAPAAGAVNPATEILFCDARGNSVVSGSLSAARALRIPVTGRPALLVEVDEIAALAPGLACP